MIRFLLAALLLSGLALPAQGQQDRQQEPGRIGEDLRKLEGKMKELIDQLRSKGQEHYATKLEQGLKKII